MGFAMMISALGFNIYYSNGWLWRIPEASRKIFLKSDDPKQYHVKYFGGHGYPYPFGYTYKNKNEHAAKVILMGDSHAQMLQHGFHEILGKPFNSTIYMAGNSCLVLPGLTRLTNPPFWDKLCPDVLKHAIKELNKREDSVLVLSEGWPFQMSIAAHISDKQKLKFNLKSKKLTDYPDLLSKLDELRTIIGNHKLIIIGEVPAAGTKDSFSCLTRPFKGAMACKQHMLPSAKANQKAININYVLQKYANSRKNTYFINPYQAFCDDKVCHDLTEYREPIYSDHSHLSLAGSLKLAELLKDQFIGIIYG